MKTAFWLSEDPIGRDIICPRDGEAGCALVDWIPRHERREQTHFMSWTWKYRLLQVRDVLFHTTLPLFSSLNLRPNHGPSVLLSQQVFHEKSCFGRPTGQSQWWEGLP